MPGNVAAALADKFDKWLARSQASDPSSPRVGCVFSVHDGVMVLDAAGAARLLRTGLRARYVWDLVLLFGLSTQEDLIRALNASDTSLRRWAGEDKLLPSQIVEKILRALQLQLVAAGVFGEVAPARVWLRSPHPMLDGLAPGDYADNEFGAGQVREMLVSLKHGSSSDRVQPREL